MLFYVLCLHKESPVDAPSHLQLCIAFFGMSGSFTRFTVDKQPSCWEERCARAFMRVRRRTTSQHLIQQYRVEDSTVVLARPALLSGPNPPIVKA